MRCIKNSILLLLICINGWATNYYVSNTGNDSNTGTTTLDPFETLNKINQIGLSPLDSIFLDKGSEFIEQLQISSDYIYIGSYGSGSNPVIKGSDTLNTWSVHSGNIYVTTNSYASDRVNFMYLNDACKHIGREPNPDEGAGEGWLFYDGFESMDKFWDNSLNSDWSGSIVALRKRNWVVDRMTVDSYDSDTFFIDFNQPTYDFDGTFYDFKNGLDGYIIQNHINTLDQVNEWSYDTTNNKFYVYADYNPNDSVIEIPIVDTLCVIDSGYVGITIEGIDFQNSNLTTIRGRFNNNLTIKNCNFSGSGLNTIVLDSCDLAIIDGNTFTDCNNYGIKIWGVSDTISNNTFTNIGSIEGMMGNNDNGGNAITSRNDNAVIYNNSFYRVGYRGIGFHGDSVNVYNNYLDSCMLLTCDGGAIYTHNAGAKFRDFTKQWITDNIILNSVGSLRGITTTDRLSRGIHLDGMSEDIDIAGNYFGGNYTGIMINSSVNILLRNNNFYDNNLTHVRYNDKLQNPEAKNVRNVMVSKTLTQRMAYINVASGFVGLLDSNYYSQFFNDTICYDVDQGVYFDFNSWRDDFGEDINTRSYPIDLLTVFGNDAESNPGDYILPLYNDATSDTTITLEYDYIRSDRTRVFNQITLAPYESVILIRTPKQKKGMLGKVYYINGSEYTIE